MNGDDGEHKIPDLFDDAHDTCCSCGEIAACHRCWLDIQMRSYPQYFLLPQHLVAFLVTFTKSATKTTKRPITHDYDDRNKPDVFDVVYVTYGRDGCSVAACHRCWLDIEMCSYLL